MDDLIRRGPLMNASYALQGGTEEYHFGFDDGYRYFQREVVGDAPAVDAVEVVHGEWVVLSTEHTFSDGTKARWNIWKCSRCPYVRTAGWEYTTEGQKPKARFCENCGARMDGRREDGDGE